MAGYFLSVLCNVRAKDPGYEVVTNHVVNAGH